MRLAAVSAMLYRTQEDLWSFLQVTENLDRHKYNVAVAELMKFSNGLSDLKTQSLGTRAYQQNLETLCTLLAPMAPHIALELWAALSVAGHTVQVEVLP